MQARVFAPGVSIRFQPRLVLVVLSGGRSRSSKVAPHAQLTDQCQRLEARANAFTALLTYCNSGLNLDWTGEALRVASTCFRSWGINPVSTSARTCGALGRTLPILQGRAACSTNRSVSKIGGKSECIYSIVDLL